MTPLQIFMATPLFLAALGFVFIVCFCIKEAIMDAYHKGEWIPLLLLVLFLWFLTGMFYFNSTLEPIEDKKVTMDCDAP